MDCAASVILLVLLLCHGYSTGATNQAPCKPTQYLELGKRGIVLCSFEGGVAISWYNSTTLVGEYPLIHYTYPAKDGIGYTSKEFDIYANGSLIIREVSLRHEHEYAVQYLYSTLEEPVVIYVNVIVIVKPEILFPVIDLCATFSNICFHEIDDHTNLICSVQNARPIVNLQWITKTTSGDRNISYEFAPEDGQKWTTSSASTSQIFYFSSNIALHTCVAKSSPGLLEKEESMILVQKSKIDLSDVKPIKKHIELNSRLSLPCSSGDIAFLIWKKRAQESTGETFDEILVYSILIDEPYTKTFATDVGVDENGALVFPEMKLVHEGYYGCFYGNGISDDVTLYDVVAYVDPTPPYPVVEGCIHQQYCELEVNFEGDITCTVQGIRPKVQLEWVTFNEKDSSLIRFENHRFSAVADDGVFDVSITSTFHLEDKTIRRITIVCRVPDSEMWDLKMKFDLHFVTEYEVAESNESNKKMLMLILLVVPLILALACICCILRKMQQRRKEKRTRKASSVPGAEGDEAQEMLSNHHSGEEEIMRQKQLFVDQLQRRYETWYNLIQPIPYIRDNLYCVDTVFVECGLEFLSPSNAPMMYQKTWTKFHSYQEIFQDSRIKARRIILEGEPGYGKSTLTLQFAYDWCNMVPASPLSDVEIFILLRLRQLSGVKSIYKAIKQFLLPVDSTLSEDDVKFVLQNSFSTVIILDGFDEYPDKTPEIDEISDVISIIRFEMFQDCDVILTTRSSFLPTKIPSQTKRVRLTGFDDNARSGYIRKAVVGDDDDAAMKIEQNLRENPILGDLCQVPLLFVIFAHMTHERKQFRKLNSVTNFFRYMISSFHSHMKNKMEEREILKYEMYEYDHRELDKVAFEALGGNNQSIVWNRTQLSQEVGQEFYDQYIRAGILVEEEVMTMIEDTHFVTTGTIQYTSEVSFYHKLFCEWYAAHYLSEYLRQSPSADLNKFLPHLDPYNLQYLYRFTCGLNPEGSDKIIDYLTKLEGGDKFAILCILEQRGKVDDVKESIRNLCREGIVISGCDSLLLQRSSTQILEIASRNEIPIEYVQLHMCFTSVDLPKADIVMDSGLRLSSEMHVKRLGIDLINREMTNEEVEELFQFALMCPALEILVTGGCMAPRSFTVGPTLSSLQSKNIQVRWKCSSESPIYILNLQSGLWENKDDGSQLTDENYSKMWQLREQSRKEWTEQDYIRDLKETRDYFSRKAQELPT